LPLALLTVMTMMSLNRITCVTCTHTRHMNTRTHWALATELEGMLRGDP
jgi:hypothetical protein